MSVTVFFWGAELKREDELPKTPNSIYIYIHLYSDMYLIRICTDLCLFYIIYIYMYVLEVSLHILAKNLAAARLRELQIALGEAWTWRSSCLAGPRRHVHTFVDI